MRILITGGYGFIGGRLGQHLHQAGNQAILGSRHVNSPPDWLPHAETVQTDWNNSLALEEICNGVDVVIQAAGMNAQDCTADPVAALEFNGLATARLLWAASRAGAKRFIYLSTAHVYSSPLAGNISEDTCPHNLHPYATSHLAGESAVLSAGQSGKIEGIVLRLSNVFGAPAHKDVNCWMLLVNDLCRQAAQSGKMVLRSSGLQQRDFISMSESCRIIGHMSSCDFNIQSPAIFNLGSGVSQTALGIAQFIQERCQLVLGFRPELEYPKARANENHEALEYQIGGLTKIGINVSIDHSMEIDSLLVFCQASFGRRRV